MSKDVINLLDDTIENILEGGIYKASDMYNILKQARAALKKQGNESLPRLERCIELGDAAIWDYSKQHGGKYPDHEETVRLVVNALSGHLNEPPKFSDFINLSVCHDIGNNPGRFITEKAIYTLFNQEKVVQNG